MDWMDQIDGAKCPPVATPGPLPVDAEGQYEVRLGLPSGWIHFRGKRLTVTCRSLGIECAAAIVGDPIRKKFGPLMDGVVIRESDRPALEAGILKRDASRATDEQKAARKAKKQAADTSALAAAIRAEFPAMPGSEVEACAVHASEIGSGRVGRSSTAGNIARKAVVAYVRHQFTPYDELLASGTSRDDARTKVLPLVTAKVNEWSPDAPIEVRPGRPSRRKKRWKSAL
jgi:hypothetical protein